LGDCWKGEKKKVTTPSVSGRKKNRILRKEKKKKNDIKKGKRPYFRDGKGEEEKSGAHLLPTEGGELATGGRGGGKRFFSQLEGGGE